MRLDLYRREIDRIDLQLMRLLNRRAQLVLRIGDLKRKQGLPIFDGRRELAVLQRAIQSNVGPLSPQSVRGIFREILRRSRRLQRKGRRRTE